MAEIEWCCRQKAGIKLVEPSSNIALGYISLAENSIGTMNRERTQNIVFSVSAGYYAMYYSVYSILAKIGIKCEIHSCTIEMMNYLDFSEEDKKKIKKAFDMRNILQYYVDKIVDDADINFLINNVPSFVSSSKDILESLNEEDIKQIRNKINMIISKSRKKKDRGEGDVE